MKANTIKAYNKRRKRRILRIYAKTFGIKYAARRKYREKEMERFLTNFSCYCFVSLNIQPRFKHFSHTIIIAITLLILYYIE